MTKKLLFLLMVLSFGLFFPNHSDAYERKRKQVLINLSEPSDEGATRCADAFIKGYRGKKQFSVVRQFHRPQAVSKVERVLGRSIDSRKSKMWKQSELLQLARAEKVPDGAIVMSCSNGGLSIRVSMLTSGGDLMSLHLEERANSRPLNTQTVVQLGSYASDLSWFGFVQ